MVKMTLGSSTSQGASASSISQQRVSAYEALIGSLQNFGGEEGLTGAAYDSAKNYATSILVPLLQGAILLSEGIGQAVPRLPQKYQAEVGGEDLDSAVLESEIAAYNSSLRSQHNLLRMLSSADEISPSAIQRVSQGITNTTKLRNDAMEKLQKLNAFANSSNSVFDGVVSDVEGAVQAGLAEIGSSFASFNGTFSSSSPSWAKKIAVEWRKKEEIDKNYQNVLDKLKYNEKMNEEDIVALAEYGKRYPLEVAKPELLKLLDDPTYKYISETYGLGTNVFDIANIMYLGSRITKDNKGNLIFNHGRTSIGKKLDEILGYNRYYSRNSVERGHNRSPITKNKGTEVRGQYEDMMDMFDTSLIKAAKDSVKSEASFGLSNIFTIGRTEGIKLSDSFKNMGKFGKGIAIANVAFSALDIAAGVGETHDIAVNHNIEVGSGEYITTQVGGVAIDTTRNVGVGVVSTVGGTALAAGAALVLASAASIAVPAGIVAAGALAIGTGIAFSLNKLDEATGFSKGLKEWWAGVVGG